MRAGEIEVEEVMRVCAGPALEWLYQYKDMLL